MVAEVGSKLLAALIAIGRILRDHARQDARQLRIDFGVERADVRNIRFHDLEHETER